MSESRNSTKQLLERHRLTMKKPSPTSRASMTLLALPFVLLVGCASPGPSAPVRTMERPLPQAPADLMAPPPAPLHFLQMLRQSFSS